MKMNDDFIYKSLPKIRKEFTESLFAKISKGTSNVSQPDMYQKLRRRRWLQAAAIVLGVFILVAGSQLRFLVRYVPVGNLWLVEYNQATQDSSDNLAAVPFVPTPLPTYDWNRTRTPEELSYSLYIPTWIPDGFEDIENLHDMMFWDSTIWMWSNEVEEDIRLSLAGGMRPYAPQGMWKKVHINGKPAILIYGRLALTSPENPTATRKWDKSLGLQLYWDMGKYTHILETYGPYVSEQDLIRMAESADELPRWPTPTP